MRHSQDRLASVAQPLPPEQLRGPSYHSWTIAQVLGHLGSQAEIFTAWLTAAVEGTDPPGREFMQPIWDAWNGRTPEEQAADSIADNERLVERFEGLTDDHLARMHLKDVSKRIDLALNDKKAPPEDTLRAHLEETKEQIAKVLGATVTQQ